MAIVLGAKSQKILSELEEPLQRIIIRAATICPAQHDFSLVEGHRPISRQLKLFQEGRTQIDGVNKKGTHNYWPSKGVDIYPYQPKFGVLIPNNECYKKLLKFHNRPAGMNEIHQAEKFVITKMSIIAGVLFAAAELEDEELVWGTDWDNDGFTLDHNFQDYPHFQRGAL